MTVGRGDSTEGMEVVGNRIEYLELLSDTRLHTHEIVDRLDDSRSTVTRALRELREGDLVEKGAEGYAATPAGTMAASAYREYEATTSAILGEKGLLEPLGSGVELPSELPRDATSYLAEERGAFALLEEVSDGIAAANRVEAYLPAIANPHLLRIWHEQVVSGRAEVDVTVPDEVFDVLQGRYPNLLGEMSDGPFVARKGSGPEYGLVLTESEGRESPMVTFLVYTDSSTGAIHGALQTAREEVIEWAEATLEEMQSRAEVATDELSELVPQRDGGTSSATIQATTVEPPTTSTPSLPSALADEGFVQLSPEDEGALGELTADPETAWRTGLTLADVAAGRGVERVRESDDGREPLDEAICSRLREENACVILGAPGSGKSTVCKQVALGWHEHGDGPVLYRERGDSAPFDSASRLEAHLRQRDGHALVVVEDVVRAEASAIFDVLATFRGADDVSFLFDARREEWHEAGSVEGFSSRRGGLGASVEPIPMPELDSTECERFIEQFEADFDIPVDETGEELLDAIRATQEWAGEDRPGEGLLARHHLAQRATPLDDADAPTTMLAEEARTVCRELTPTELDIAVLTAVLTAGGLPVADDLLYALVEEWPATEVAHAVETLRGRLLFENSAERGSEYRTRHEFWATEFLGQFVAVEGEEVARRRFERCVNALLTLTTDKSRREQIREDVDEPYSNLSQIAHHPTTWADEAVERIFRIGIRNPHLAPLYGEPETSDLVLPDACSVEREVQVAYWRGRMANKRADLEQTVAEYEHVRQLAESVEGLSSTMEARLKVRSLTRQSELETTKGETAVAEEHCERALEIAQEADDSVLLAEAHWYVALWNGRRGDIEAGRRHLNRTLEHARSAGHTRFVGRALNHLGTANWEEGKLDKAARLFEEAAEIAREAGDWVTLGDTAGTLGTIEWERANLDRSKRHAHRSREISRLNQSTRFTAYALLNLGRVACSRGELEDAVDYVEEGMDVLRGRGSHWAVYKYHCLRSRIERYRGNFDEASEFAEQALSSAEDFGTQLGIAQAGYHLAAIALCREDIETARQHFERIQPLREELQRPKEEAKFDLLSAQLAYHSGEYRRALEVLDEAEEVFRDVPRPRFVVECNRLRVAIAIDRGSIGETCVCIEEALQLARESGDIYFIGRIAEAAGDACRERKPPRAARAHYRQAVEAFDELGNDRATERLLEKLEDCTR